MILSALGKLCVAQAITEADEISENVIQVAAVDYAKFHDLWWVVDTYVAAGGDAADTFKFALVVAQEAALSNIKEVCAVEITGIADRRIAAAGRNIIAVNIGKILVNVLGADDSTYALIGQTNTVSAGGTITINAALSPTEPQTDFHAQVITSPVGIPSVCSDGSGF